MDEKECKRFNMELMKSMIYKKAKKNVSYEEFMTGKTGKGSHDLLSAPRNQ